MEMETIYSRFTQEDPPTPAVRVSCEHSASRDGRFNCFQRRVMQGGGTMPKRRNVGAARGFRKKENPTKKMAESLTDQVYSSYSLIEKDPQAQEQRRD